MNSILTSLILVFLFKNGLTYYISPVRFANTCLDTEIYFSCGNACDLTCANVTESKASDNDHEKETFVMLNKPCRYDCISGCFCRASLLRNRFGDCVQEEKCHPVLSRNSLVDELNKLIDIYDLTGSSKHKTKPKMRQDQIDDFFENLNIEKSINDEFEDFFGMKSKNQPGVHRVSSTHTQQQNKDDLEDYIDKEAQKIIKQINSGLKLKSFVKKMLRELIQESRYSESEQLSQKSNRNGLISASNGS